MARFRTTPIANGIGRNHYYFLTRRPVRSFKADDPKQHPLGLNIDLRGAGGYVVTGGSNHESGSNYEFGIQVAPILPMPEWMEALLEYDGESNRQQIEPTREEIEAKCEGGIPPRGLPFHAHG